MALGVTRPRKYRIFSHYLRTLLASFLVHVVGAQPRNTTTWACGDNKPAKIYEPDTLIQSPLYGNGSYQLNQNCQWMIEAPPGEVIRLTFAKFDLEDVYLCWYAYVSVFDGYSINDDELIETYCGRDLPEVTYTSTHAMYIHYESMDQGEGTGFEANVQFIPITSVACSDSRPAVLSWKQGGFVSPEWPAGYPTGKRCSWRIDTQLDLRLEFVEWNLRPPDPVGCTDAVKIYNGPTITDPLIGTYCGQDRPDVTGKMSRYLLIEFESLDFYYQHEGGFRVKYSTVNITEQGCGENHNLDIDWSPGFITGPLTDESNCRWRFYAPEGKVVRFEIEKFDLPLCANCGCAKVSVFNGDQPDEYFLIGTYCENGWAEKFIQSGGNKASMTYESYRLSPGTGFVIKYTFFDFSDHACSLERPINLTHEYGIITSPHYDNGYYDNNQHCEWAISAALGKVIEIHFLTFDLQSCIGCACDALYIYNGDSPKTEREVRTLCDNHIPSLFMTSLPGAYLRFISDDSSIHEGFKIEYEIINLADKACGEGHPVDLTMTPGDILSPNYGNGYYPQSSSCQWHLTASEGKSIKVNFMDFDLEHDEPSRCHFDWLKIYDGNDADAVLMAKLCGCELPAPVVSTGNTMFIIFESNQYIEAHGFHLTFEETDPLKTNRTVVIITVSIILCGVLMLTAAIVGLFIYRKKQKFKTTSQTMTTSLATVLGPTVAQPGLSERRVSDDNGLDDVYQEITEDSIISSREQTPEARSDFLVMLSPPSYQEFCAASGSVMDCPPPTYEESLCHRLARNDHGVPTPESEWAHNFGLAEHIVDMNETGSDPDHVAADFSHVINEAFVDEDDSNAANPDWSLPSGSTRLEFESSHVRNISYETQTSRTRERTGSACYQSVSVDAHERKYSSTEGQQLMVRKQILQKERLSKSYDDLLHLNTLTALRKDVLSSERNPDVNQPSTSNEISNPDKRRRTKSETHLLSVSTSDLTGNAPLRLCVLQPPAGVSRETSV